MASEENQEQPAANQSSSNPEEPESLEQQELSVTQSEDILEINNTESLTEEFIQVQPEVPAEDSELISPVTQSPSDIEEEKIEPTSSQLAGEVVADSPQPNQNKNWWDVILDKIRSFLPDSMNKSLSDWALTAIVSSLIVLILSVSVILLPSRASSDTISKSTDTVSIPKQEREIIPHSNPTKEAEEKNETETLSNSSEIVSTSGEVETSETLVAPKKSAGSTVKNPRSSQAILTPEQSLYSAVQEKVSKITSQYADELIVSGEADLLGSHLLIKVSDDWYKLNKSRQDEFANGTLKRSQKFNFNKLEIQDVQNNIIARSPVVGNKMIILRRAN